MYPAIPPTVTGHGLRKRGSPAIELLSPSSRAAVDQKYRQKLESSIKAGGNSGSVVWAESLSRKEMAWCYASCSVFVITSRVEACQNTALEALAYGRRFHLGGGRETDHPSAPSRCERVLTG